MEQANVSQHLAVLRAKQLVSNRKAGNQVFYSVRDPILIEVLNLMRTYFHAHLKESLAMLDEMEKPAGNRPMNSSHRGFLALLSVFAAIRPDSFRRTWLRG